MRGDSEGSIRAARRSREQKARLTAVAKELRARRDLHSGSGDAAIEIHKRARAKCDHDLRYDSYGWARDLGKLTRMVEVTKKIDRLKKPRWSQRTKPVPTSAKIIERDDGRVAQWKGAGRRAREAPVVQAPDGTDRIKIVRRIVLTEGQQRALHDLEQERATVCGELGYEHPFDSPNLKDMIAIARAVDAGHEADPDRLPPGWPKNRRWLREPAGWDPDLRVGEVVRETIREGKHLLRSREDSHLRLAWCIDLALDPDRSVLKQLLQLAGEERREIAGVTRRLLDLVVEGCSPIRATLAWGWAGGDNQNPARTRLLALPRREGHADAITDDLAESATATDHAQLDSHLLDLAEELLEILGGPSVGDEAQGEDPPGEPAMFIREGKNWRLSFGGLTKSFPPSKGLERIHRLLCAQGVEVRVEDLVGAKVLDQGVPASDKKALEAVRGRVGELQAQIESGGDPVEILEAKEELEIVQSHLESQVGLLGKERRLGDDGAAAANAAGKSIVRAIEEIRSELPELADHLRRVIIGEGSKTPTYRPAEHVPWVL